ncbi:TetR/AcrR family transcriptional regulator, partial [Xanthomonas oryzae pv. oryzae]
MSEPRAAGPSGGQFHRKATATMRLVGEGAQPASGL